MERIRRWRTNEQQFNDFQRRTSEERFNSEKDFREGLKKTTSENSEEILNRDFREEVYIRFRGDFRKQTPMRKFKEDFTEWNARGGIQRRNSERNA